MNLDDIRIASPCKANWNEMAGDERIRLCGSCRLQVYNLEGLTRREATDLLESSEGRVCMRFYRRMDGTVLTKDCPEGARIRFFKRLLTVAAAVLAVVCIGTSLDGRALSLRMESWEPVRRIESWLGLRDSDPVVGQICPPPRKPAPRPPVPF